MEKTDLTNLILNDFGERKDPTLKLFIITIIILLLIISVIVITNKNSDLNKNITKIEKKKMLTQKVSKKKEIKKEIGEKKEFYTDKRSYYIQVSVFSKNKTIDKYFLKKITKNNYKYIIKEDHKFKKILLGPFNGYDNSKQKLINIQKEISKDAFMIRIKK